MNRLLPLSPCQGHSVPEGSLETSVQGHNCKENCLDSFESQGPGGEGASCLPALPPRLYGRLPSRRFPFRSSSRTRLFYNKQDGERAGAMNGNSSALLASPWTLRKQTEGWNQATFPLNFEGKTKQKQNRRVSVCR